MNQIDPSQIKDILSPLPEAQKTSRTISNLPVQESQAGLMEVRACRDSFIRAVVEAIRYNGLAEFFLVNTSKGPRSLRNEDLDRLTSQDQIEPDWKRVRQENRTPGAWTERQRIFLALILHMYNADFAARTIKKKITLEDCVCMMQGNDGTNRSLWSSLIAFYPGW